MSLEGKGFVASSGVPQLDCPILATAEDASSIWTKGDCADSFCVSFEGPDQVAVIRIPDRKNAVSVSANDFFIVVVKGCVTDTLDARPSIENPSSPSLLVFQTLNSWL